MARKVYYSVQAEGVVRLLRALADALEACATIRAERGCCSCGPGCSCSTSRPSTPDAPKADAA